MRPFEGIRVLDLTHVFAGPFCTHQLAMLGAEVIKIEGPNSPDMTRQEGSDKDLSQQGMGISYLAHNAGKKSLVLDLKSSQGREIFINLVKTADVMIQNYSGTSLARLGLAAEDMQAVNPTLIYCQMTGFGQTGPKAEHPAYDAVIQAFAGVMVANGTSDEQPLRIGPAVIDYGTGAQAAIAVISALFQREKTGQGQVIDVAMVDAALMLMAYNVADNQVSGTSLPSHGNQDPLYPCYSAYQTKDGQLMLGAFTTAQAAAAMRVLGNDRAADAILTTPRWELKTRAAEDRAYIEKVLMTKTAAEWEFDMNAADVPAARVRSILETMQEEQVKSRNVLAKLPESELVSGHQQYLIAAFCYAHGGPQIDRAPPRFGQHTVEILSAAGVSDSALAELREAGVIVYNN